MNLIGICFTLDCISELFLELFEIFCQVVDRRSIHCPSCFEHYVLVDRFVKEIKHIAVVPADERAEILGCLGRNGNRALLHNEHSMCLATVLEGDCNNSISLADTCHACIIHTCSDRLVVCTAVGDIAIKLCGICMGRIGLFDAAVCNNIALYLAAVGIDGTADMHYQVVCCRAAGYLNIFDYHIRSRPKLKFLNIDGTA